MTRLELLTVWVRNKHDGQLIKKTAEPYFDHLIAVAEIVAPKMRFGYETGLCHDLLEKTETDTNEFSQVLKKFGYKQDEVDFIIDIVIELTDVYTKSAYSGLKKSARKEKEETRLVSISPEAQTVKYADLIYNVTWMMKYDLKHAENYLKRKQQLLNIMFAGDPELLNKVSQLILDSLQSF